MVSLAGVLRAWQIVHRKKIYAGLRGILVSYRPVDVRHRKPIVRKEERVSQCPLMAHYEYKPGPIKPASAITFALHRGIGSSLNAAESIPVEISYVLYTLISEQDWSLGYHDTRPHTHVLLSTVTPSRVTTDFLRKNLARPTKTKLSVSALRV